ncbi:MAG: acylphosphatase [Desulfobacteraceae bacterium Eth-SRB1]|nr:MAG: acylphosphatase [Desulfobacteraceae bacterium Eth-SRB1]
MGKKVRAHVLIVGRVQGVFFRMETKRTADGAGVYGWVKNKRDGTVEAVFEGDEESVGAVVKWCKKGPPISIVNGVDIKWEDYTGEYGDFEITF